MGLFKHKQAKGMSPDDMAAAEQHFLDENFREELRNHGRLYFEKVINENGVLFKQDLDATITQINADLKDHTIKQLDETIAQISTELKDHVTKQLDEHFMEYDKAMKTAQDEALQSITRSAQAFQDQHAQLTTTLQKSIANQEVMMSSVFEQNMARMTATKDVQDAALVSLNESAKSIQDKYQELSAALESNVASQEAMLVNAFEQNMARIIEHYLLGALGDQYDLKAQLPSIIKQMEANKQAIADDMKL